MKETFGVEEKLEILKQNEVDFDSVPRWQKFGVGAYWQAGVDGSEPALVLETDLPAETEAFREYLARYI